MEAVHVLTPIIFLLVLGILAITLTRPLGLSPIVGYLVAGLIVGPHALGLIAESETTRLLAELGVVFLLFDIGLHFSLTSIWEARRDILGLAPVQVVLCGVIFGAIAVSLGFAMEYALIVGGALALSSTAVVIQTLSERNRRNCPVGLTATAVLIFQDLIAIFLLIFAVSLEPGASSGAEPSLSTAIVSAVLKSAAAFLVAVLIGRYAVGPAFRFLAKSMNEEVFTATALLVVLAAGAATGGAGLSLTLGAFLGGMMISETPYRHVIQTEAKPFRNLLLGFFFITVGMSLDWRMLLEYWAEILTFLVALIAIKTVLVAAAARSFGWSTPGAAQLGFLLAQGSEFVFVIVAMPVVRAALGEGPVGVIIMGVAISLALTPTIAALGNSVARLLRSRSTVAAPPSEASRRGATVPVIIFGMGDIGRSVADALEANGLAYDAVEMDYERFLAASADGYRVAFGDLGDVRLMETVAMAERSTVVVTVIRYEVSEALTPILRDRYPNLIRFIAVDNDQDRARFEALGMRGVVNRSVPRGLDLAAAVLRSQGVDEDRIMTWMQREQERALESTGGARYAYPSA
jgi:monovalent cation:proton antiporter-2 (CPA2) family protein